MIICKKELSCLNDYAFKLLIMIVTCVEIAQLIMQLARYLLRDR